MRIVLGIEYDGSHFYGWQTQQNLPTIQGSLQEAIEKVANERINLFCAGRTDTKVHANGQVAHFDTRAKRHIDAWIWGTNSHLPSSIVVRWAKAVDYSFHARFTALSRRYRYVIYNHPVRPALLNSQTTWHYYPLDIISMRESLKYLLGEQDFSSFRSSECNAKTPMRNVIDAKIERQGNYIILEIEANAFLHHMVRNIVGVLMKIGAGVREPIWMKEVLLAKSRRSAAETAPPNGLYLTHVQYKEPYVFPTSDNVFVII
jgi:tRNA pseudouridine38-40 synthase